MSESIHFGDNITQEGDHNVGKQQIEFRQQGNRAEAVQEMLGLARALRDQLPEEDRQTIDDSLAGLSDGAADSGALRQVLQRLAGVAAMAGQIGLPLLQSIQIVRDVYQ